MLTADSAVGGCVYSWVRSLNILKCQDKKTVNCTKPLLHRTYNLQWISTSVERVWLCKTNMSLYVFVKRVLYVQIFTLHLHYPRLLTMNVIQVVSSYSHYCSKPWVQLELPLHAPSSNVQKQVHNV